VLYNIYYPVVLIITVFNFFADSRPKYLGFPRGEVSDYFIPISNSHIGYFYINFKIYFTESYTRIRFLFPQQIVFLVDDASRVEGIPHTFGT